MFKMIVKAKQEYSSQDNIELIRQICLETNFKESSPCHYYLDNQYDELGRMIVLEAKFQKHNIIPILNEWKTFSDEEGEVNELVG